jgi:hypothetical protein
MSRKRTPSPEQQKCDHVYANACESIINALLDRYPSNVGLTIASRGLAEFRATSDITQPKPRARKPKAQPEQPSLASV